MTYHPGDHLVISDISGQKFRRSKCKLNWKGQLVNSLTEWEPKHPQLTITPKTERISVSDARPRQADRFFVPTADDL